MKFKTALNIFWKQIKDFGMNNTQYEFVKLKKKRTNKGMKRGRERRWEKAGG